MYKERAPFPDAAFVRGQQNLTYFDLNLTSGLVDQIIRSPGDCFYIDQASTGFITVEMNGQQSGSLAPLLVGAGAFVECDFATLKINAAAQTNKTVRLMIGNGVRIKGGANVNPTSQTIQTVDGGKERTLANNAYVKAIFQGASALNYAHAQLWNPAGSGKNVFLERVMFSSSTGGFVSVMNYNIQFGIDAGAALPKKLYGTVGQTHGWTSSGPAVLGSNYLATLAYTANTIFQWDFKEPVLIAPGQGVHVVHNTVNTDITAVYEWFEE